MSKDELSRSLTPSKVVKIKDLRKNLYEIENEKNLPESKIKEIGRNLTELEENLSKTKKYYDYDDIEY